MSKPDHGWSKPTSCRICQYPVALAQGCCPQCSTPILLFSPASSRVLFRTLKRFGKNLFEISICVVLAWFALDFCWRVSPLLILFPLLCVAYQKGEG